MIVVYAQEWTNTRNDVNATRNIFTGIYGEKLGAQDYVAVKASDPLLLIVSMAAPLVRVVSDKQAAEIREMVADAGMMICDC